MNREIKFRGLVEETKKWRYGYFVKKIRLGAYGYYIIDENGKSYSCIPNTIMQYTGLKDKNGVEIYEGDIVKCANGMIAEIIYNDNAEFRMKIRYQGRPIFYSMRQLDYIAIGNIYENPELLEN